MGEITMEIKPEKKAFTAIWTLDQIVSESADEWVGFDLELQQALVDGWEILNITVLGDETFTQRVITMKRVEEVE